DPLLGLADGRSDHAMLDDLALLHAHLLHEHRDALRAEQPHEVVFERQEEARGARVALATRAAAQLAVDAARLVSLRAEDVEPAQLGDAGAELDVRASAGHVRRDRDRALLS